MVITFDTTDGWSTKKEIIYRLIFVNCTCPLIVISHRIWLLCLILIVSMREAFSQVTVFRKSRHCRNSHGVRSCVSCDAHFISVAVTLLTLGWIKSPVLVQNTNLHQEQALVVPLDPCFRFSPTSLTCQCVMDVRIRSNRKVWHPRCASRKRNIIYLVRSYTTFILAKRIAATCFGRIYQIHTASWWLLCAAERCSCFWFCYNKSWGDRGSTVVKVLYYNSEGRWFDPNWCHWNFSLT